MSSVDSTPEEKKAGWRGEVGRSTTLVLTGVLTIMAGATVSPAVPGIREAFAGTPNVDLLSRMITTMHALAIVVFSPVAGRVVERLGRKWALVLGMCAFGAGGSSGAYLPGLVSILAGRIVLGVGVALVMTSALTMITDLYEGEKRRRLMGRQAAASSLGGVVLLLSGGALADLEWRVVFLLYLLGVALVVPTLLFLPAGRSSGEAAANNERRGSSRPTGRIPGVVLAALLAMLLGQVTFYSVPVQIPFLAESDFGAGSVLSGALIAVQTFTTGVVGMRYDLFRRLAGEWTLTALAFLAIGTGYAALALASGMALLLGGLLVVGLGLGVLIPNLNNWVMTESAADARSRHAGFLTLFLFSGQFLAPLVTQPVVENVGIQGTFGVIGAVALAIGVVYYLAGRGAARRTEVSEQRSSASDGTERRSAVSER